MKGHRKTNRTENGASATVEKINTLYSHSLGTCLQVQNLIGSSIRDIDIWVSETAFTLNTATNPVPSVFVR